MAVTQQDIALKLGVSQRLVSYALNGQNGVGEEMRRKIQDEAEALGYRPDRAAQALATGRTHQIAICFPYFLGSSYYNAIIREFEILARHTPYDLLMITVDFGRPKSSNIQFTADGMIYVGPASQLPHNSSLPALAIQNHFRQPRSAWAEEFDRVEFNLERGARDVMRHLLDQGFKRIAFVAAEDMIMDIEWRFHSYRTAMQEAGFSQEVIALPIAGEELIRQKSHQCLKDYFSEKGFPEALFCCNDDIGMGAYRALGEMGRKIPDETAVVGFDDLDYANYLNPPMTSVHMPIAEMCKSAWEMMMQRLEDKTLPPQFKSIEAHLVIRESSLLTVPAGRG